eukprot:GHVH01012263.1.p1 GENE.GHVH01012263.1~~GHVH01012263.1.p1  ORF type:complete len:349 (+),score=47.51 GHVH01012263.1:140-1186(+)
MPVGHFTETNLCPSPPRSHYDAIALFDMDGTLTTNREVIKEETSQMLVDLSQYMTVGIVSGGRLDNLKNQLPIGLHPKVVQYIFAENGSVASRDDSVIGYHSIDDHVNAGAVQSLKMTVVEAIKEHAKDIDTCYQSIARKIRMGTIEDGGWLRREGWTFTENEVTTNTIDLWLDQRSGLWNLTLLGPPPNVSIRRLMSSWNEQNADLRPRICARIMELQTQHYANMARTVDNEGGTVEPHLPWRLVCGGALSIDMFPVGWDKSRVLKYLDPKQFTAVYFFGDRTNVGGNDHELFVHPRTTGFTVEGYEDTIEKVRRHLINKNVEEVASRATRGALNTEAQGVQYQRAA